MRGRWLGGVSVALGLWAGAASAEDVTWRPMAGTPAVAATLGRPVPLSRPPAPETNVAPVSYSSQPAATLGPIIRAQAADPPPPGTAPVQPVPPFNDVLNPAPVADPAGLHGPAGGGPAWLNGGWLGTYQGCSGRGCLQSDHCFDCFISPVTRPSIFEDPRALTEVRPIFMWQQTSTKNPIYHGGDIEFFGMQARVAITERLSVTISELGWLWQEVHNPTGDFASHSGFAQMELGGKYTFLRQENWGTVGAFGLTLEVPVGDKSVFQDTGSLSVRPFLSLAYAPNFAKTSYGSFNFMTTTAGSFAVDNKRADFIYTGLHVDFDVANLHKIYPLMELNWFHYTGNGTARDQNFEGADLFNFGATHASGQNVFSLALGARYKFREWLQLGSAAEWTLTGGSRSLENFRLTVDLIFRY